jgi:D-alanyl-D-alanine carboxypeptidase
MRSTLRFRPTLALARVLARALALALTVAACADVVFAQGARADRPPGSPRRTATRTAALTRRLDSAVVAWLAAGESPSVSVAVVRGRDTLLVRAYGKANLEWDAAATPATVYRTGSVTKQFTAALVLQLVDSGRVRLDDAIATHLPAVPARWRAVTVRQLLNHTSGIRSYTSTPAGRRRFAEDLPPDTLVMTTAGDSLEFAPGSAWNYNNTGYLLLGMLLERVTGRPYETLLAERLFRPVGLTETRYCHTDPLVKWRAAGYYRDDDGFHNAPWLSMTQPFSAGSLCSTARDLVRWNQALHGGRVVSARSYAAMTTAEGGALKAPIRYGFGLIADTLAGHPMVTHGGSIHGFMAANAWFPTQALSVTILANAMTSKPDALMRTLARIVVEETP